MSLTAPYLLLTLKFLLCRDRISLLDKETDGAARKNARVKGKQVQNLCEPVTVKPESAAGSQDSHWSARPGRRPRAEMESQETCRLYSAGNSRRPKIKRQEKEKCHEKEQGAAGFFPAFGCGAGRMRGNRDGKE